MSFKIEKNIPIPHKAAGRPPNEKIHSVLENMEIGDSFALETDATSSIGTVYSKSVGTFISTGRRNYNYKFVQRLSDDKKKVRLWRIE